MKRAITSHQHSLELQFPHTLDIMASAARKGRRGSRDGEGVMDGDRDDITNAVLEEQSSSNVKQFQFDPLFQNHADQQQTGVPSTYNHPNLSTETSTLLSEPLLFYLAAVPYHAIYCTNKKNNKEDWTQRDPYWKAVADFLTTGTETGTEIHSKQKQIQEKNNFFNGKLTEVYESNDQFSKALQNNMGLDFLVPASHPQSGPSRVHPASLSYLQRATFLKTDFDISGSEPKDIIVPYYVSDHDNKKGEGPGPVPDESSLHRSSCWNSENKKNSTVSSYVLYNRSLLLFFSGSDNPYGGYRTLFHQQLQLLYKVYICICILIPTYVYTFIYMYGGYRAMSHQHLQLLYKVYTYIRTHICICMYT